MFRNRLTWLTVGFVAAAWGCGAAPTSEEDGTSDESGEAGNGGSERGASQGSGGKASGGSGGSERPGTGGVLEGSAGNPGGTGGKQGNLGSGGRTAGGGGAAGHVAGSGGSTKGSGGGVGGSAGKTDGTAGSASGGGGRSGSGCSPVFASGLNVAWLPNKYAVDIPDPDLDQFDKLFKDSVGSGGRIVRWWFHTNGTTTPSWDSSTGFATRITDAEIADVKSLADTAQKDGAALVISLWSHNMLMRNQMTAQILANNKALLQKDANRQAYIDNVLTPLVTALKGHPGIYAWEAFNEPEGMINDGPNTTPWTVDKAKPETADDYVSIKDIQKTVNWFGAAVHAVDPNARFTNGAWTLLANTDVDGHTNYYSDQQLVDVGGKENGTLDFYEIHYYDNWGTPGAADVISPLVHPASYWKLDKPLMVGEFWAIDTGSVKADDIYTKLYDTGYNGAWAWQYANADNPGPSSPTQWPAMKPGMDKLYQAHKADLDCP